MIRRLFKLLAILLLLLLAVPTVLATVRIDDEGQVPFYARIARNEIFHDGEWAAVVFYRPPSCIPADFNLLDFFDVPDGSNLGAFDCQPPTTDSFSIWQNGPEVDAAPLIAKFSGLGAVPVWFVSWPEIETAVADDVLTIGELAALPSLLTGTASFYKEILHPAESPAPGPGKIQFTARGTLADGRSFLVQVNTSNRPGTLTPIHIVFR